MFTSIWSTAKLGGMVLAAATLAASGIAVGSVGSSPVLVAAPSELAVALHPTTDVSSDVASHRRWLIGATAEALGLEVGVLLERVAVEGSLGAVADSVGVGTDTLIGLLVADAEHRFALVGPGDRDDDPRIDQVTLTNRITELVNAEVAHRVQHGIDRAERRTDRLARAAELLDVTPQELRSAHAAGAVDELIAAAGMTVHSFVDRLLEPFVEHLETRVATGLMSEDEAAGRLADVTSRIVAALSEVTQRSHRVAR